MSEVVIDDIVAVLPPLLGALDALGFIARHLHPPAFDRLMEAVGTPEASLSTARAQLSDWPAEYADVRAALDHASEEALAAFAGLRAVQQGEGDLGSVFRALRHWPRAQEALYPLAAKFPPVSDFFLEPELREEAATGLSGSSIEAERPVQNPRGEEPRSGVSNHEAQLSPAAMLRDGRLRRPPQHEAEQAGAASPQLGDITGISHEGGEAGKRGGFSLYVPEFYSADRSWPLVMALHGGSGNGRSFLWSWLRSARSFGAIVVAPTAIGPTWALMGEDRDTPNLMRILDLVRSRYAIDPNRLLLTGMSDGGTFCYVSALERASPFTHLAPVAATFHPLMADMADRERLSELPIFITHGALDWMFPVQVARQTQALLAAAGAAVTYRELDDLSHAYPREINAEILRWMDETPAGQIQGRPG